MARIPGRSRAPSAPPSSDRRPQDRRERPTPERRHGRHGQPRPKRRPWSALGTRSVAGQVFVLQVVIVLLLVLAVGVETVLQARNDTATEARNRSLAVAETYANSPGIVPALRSPDPTALLQPSAEAARVKAGVDFIVVLSTDSIRYTHPMPDRIGKKFVGTTAPALAGQSITEEVDGTIGHLVQAVVPVTDSDGTVVGMVSAGIRTSRVSDTTQRQLPILLGAAAGALVLATAGSALVSRRLRRQTRGLGPAAMTSLYEHHDAVLHAVREGVLILDGDGRLLLANDEAGRLLELPPDAEGRQLTDLGLDRRTVELLASTQPVTDEVLAAGERLLVVNIRPTDRNGGPPGTVATLRDSTELRALSGKADLARRRLKLLYEAGLAIGTTLDVTRTAQELADAAVPGFADYVTVDLAEPVLRGDEPEPTPTMRRVGLSSIHPDPPFYPPGGDVPLILGTPRARAMELGEPVAESDLSDALTAWLDHDPHRVGAIRRQGVHALLAVPLRARGVVLGIATFWRSERPEPFGQDDVWLGEELVARAAVCIDNARRYTREHTMAVTLQHSLLPGGLPEQDALDVAYRYLPAQAGVGGDWFDVIPLPGARVALVVGDVVGHGVHAAATMGRLRTAVHNFASLDLPPDELLGLMDDLVNRIDQEQDAATGEAPITGATCLYAIYDPVTLRCTVARAGHLLPAVVRPDGAVEFPEVPAGPPLGLVGLPFETAELQLAEGSKLVLYTDGLVEDRERDIDVGLELLRVALAGADRTPEQTCADVLATLLPANPTDDIALLVAMARALPADQVAEWEVPPDPAAVREIRAGVTARLEAWGLDELAFTTELILSELITNAIRYGLPPIRVRLIRDRTLICEVSDGSSTSPHLRYAASTDEGGRGLFLVAQFAERWGTRYTAAGKVIWAEQRLP
ncbi:SpoIIE family protein phosphatase [Kitasatospora sp. NPDC094015]|uniref:SpoIIE family protein phosphatase n=1 Tax=Kitasatospora sp. NPDC094015 TaxID=3155205 RepID=UPI00332E1003